MHFFVLPSSCQTLNHDIDIHNISWNVFILLYFNILLLYMCIFLNNLSNLPMLFILIMILLLIFFYSHFSVPLSIYTIHFFFYTVTNIKTIEIVYLYYLRNDDMVYTNHRIIFSMHLLVFSTKQLFNKNTKQNIFII